MNRMPAFLDLRTRLLTADRYFGIQPSQRSACVQFLLALALAEGGTAEAAEENQELWEQYCEALVEARYLVESGELDPLELPVLDVAAPSPAPKVVPEQEPKPPEECRPETALSKLEAVPPCESEGKPEAKPGPIELKELRAPVEEATAETVSQPQGRRSPARSRRRGKQRPAEEVSKSDRDVWELVASLAE